MCLFHLAVEVVLLNAVQADLQTHSCPIIVCSNRQLVTRSRPACKDLELAPKGMTKTLLLLYFTIALYFIVHVAYMKWTSHL